MMPGPGMRNREFERPVKSAPLVYWGAIGCLLGIAAYLAAIVLSIVRLLLWLDEPFRKWIATVIWFSGVTTTIGVLLVTADLVFLLQRKRRIERREDGEALDSPRITVALTAYNDARSIFDAVVDFLAYPLVARVIVVSNNSRDDTEARARAAGAMVYNESLQGYGHCVYRCLEESLRHDDTDYIVLCEGDRTFRARDLDKLLAYRSHADVVNGTRIVEQLRAYATQLTTPMYYGNFFVAKLLELKHFGRGTFTDVGTTYKLMRHDALMRLLPHLDRRINLEFNAHFMDLALSRGLLIVECPITFHARVGIGKGGNVNNLRAMKVGIRMIAGLSFGWRWIRS
jgi:glycosyltransferase involved in cell wall biosynthesis